MFSTRLFALLTACANCLRLAVARGSAPHARFVLSRDADGAMVLEVDIDAGACAAEDRRAAAEVAPQFRHGAELAFSGIPVVFARVVELRLCLDLALVDRTSLVSPDVAPMPLVLPNVTISLAGVTRGPISLIEAAVVLDRVAFCVSDVAGVTARLRQKFRTSETDGVQAATLDGAHCCSTPDIEKLIDELVLAAEDAARVVGDIALPPFRVGVSLSTGSARSGKVAASHHGAHS